MSDVNPAEYFRIEDKNARHRARVNMTQALDALRMALADVEGPDGIITSRTAQLATEAMALLARALPDLGILAAIHQAQAQRVIDRT